MTECPTGAQSHTDELAPGLMQPADTRGDRFWRTAQALVGAASLVAALLAVASLALPESTHARDLGVIGPVHPIAEQDMLDWIQARLLALQASGDLARRQAEAQSRALATVRQPVPVQGLRAAQVARDYLFDPSVRFDEPVLDEKGRVVVPSGTVANPLSMVSMHSTWLFFDGRDARQVALVAAELVAASRSGRVLKPILVAGSPTELSERWRTQVYFDQGGLMVRRLGIGAVPARVTQDGQLLRVQEFPAP